VGFDRQHILARPVGQSSSTTSTFSIGMSISGNPITYDELPPEHKQKFDSIKA
jgi:hypothetical protein